ncbi:hypothetical protein OUZ56_011864 [Daphnia magna]|uniref:Uncharacterized protein n=1 Tax=Daphnia magna TaxID=35525 RepID=A0ABQ9Z1D1_9CRUS|nr:hypothetical protein OUZ56_011864 [Daphnia magna]
MRKYGISAAFLSSSTFWKNMIAIGLRGNDVVTIELYRSLLDSSAVRSILSSTHCGNNQLSFILALRKRTSLGSHILTHPLDFKFGHQTDIPGTTKKGQDV